MFVNREEIHGSILFRHTKPPSRSFVVVSVTAGPRGICCLFPYFHALVLFFF